MALSVTSKETLKIVKHHIFMIKHQFFLSLPVSLAVMIKKYKKKKDIKNS